jgi:hypothetical protein
VVPGLLPAQPVSTCFRAESRVASHVERSQFAASSNMAGLLNVVWRVADCAEMELNFVYHFQRGAGCCVRHIGVHCNPSRKVHVPNIPVHAPFREHLVEVDHPSALCGIYVKFTILHNTSQPSQHFVCARSTL